MFWSFLSHSRIFHSFWHVTIAGEGLQILTYARHLWPLSSAGSLACHKYCYTGHPFIIVIVEFLIIFYKIISLNIHKNMNWFRLPSKSVSSTAVTILLTTKVCRGWHMNYQPSACDANVSMEYAIAAEVMLLKKDIHDWWISSAFLQCMGYKSIYNFTLFATSTSNAYLPYILYQRDLASWY